MHGLQVLELASEAVLPQLATAQIESTAYPLDRCYPLDSQPILGFATQGPTRVYVAVMHSGVTLGPLMGQLAAQEIAEDVSLPEFEPFRVSRKFDNSSKYSFWEVATK